MSTALFTVKATITPERENAFNHWYNHEHIPDVFKFKGVVSARRYKAIMPEDKFLKSDHFMWLRKEYDAHFGDVSERQRAAYVQVWP